MLFVLFGSLQETKCHIEFIVYPFLFSYCDSFVPSLLSLSQLTRY